MNAIKVGNNLSLVCTTVLDQVTLGLVEEDEETHEVTDRAYWEQRGTKETVALTDDLLEVIKTFAPDLILKYNKFYIGLARNDQPNNFVIFKPKKNGLRIKVRLPPLDDLDAKLDQTGLDVMDYDKRWGRHRIRLSKADIKKQNEFLVENLKGAYQAATD